MGAAVERLTSLVDSPQRFAIPYAELRQAQIEAMNERFQERKDRIRLLGHRAKEAASPRSARREDMVPLLFPHTAYKSYPESCLDREEVGPAGQVARHGLVLPDRSDRDLRHRGHRRLDRPARGERALRLLLERHDRQVGHAHRLEQGHGVVAPGHGRRLLLGLGRRAGAGSPHVRCRADRPRAQEHHHRRGAGGGVRRPRFERFRLPVPPITVGQLTKMVVLRKAIADGTARPGEIAEFEATSKARQQALDEADDHRGRGARRGARGQALHLGPVERAVSGRQAGPRDGLQRQGFPPGQLHLRRRRPQASAASARLPASSSTRPSTSRPTGISRTTACRSSTPACPAVRKAAATTCRRGWFPSCWTRRATRCCRIREGEIEGRAAFFDLALDGRWGGVITGDKISLDFGPCACGRQGPVDPRQHRPLCRSRRRRQDRLRGHRGRLRERAVMSAHRRAGDRHARRSRRRSESITSSAASWCAGDAVRHTSRDLGVEFTTPAIDLDALDHAALRDAAAVRREARRRSSTSSSKWASGSIPSATSTCRNRSSSSRRPTRCRGGSSRTCSVRARHFLTRDVLMASSKPTSTILRHLDEWVERTDCAGPDRSDPRLSAADDPHARRQLTRGLRVLDRAGRDGEGDQRLQDALERSRSPASPCCGPWRTSIREHPVVKSMSAVYWRGGDERIERTLYRPQYFNRIVAWGGGSAINNVIKYLGPGLQLVSFDPKTSISMIGPEAFQSDEAIAQVAEAAAEDVTAFNQEACLASRIHLRRRRARAASRNSARGCRSASASTASWPPQSRRCRPRRCARRWRCCR